MSSFSGIIGQVFGGKHSNRTQIFSWKLIFSSYHQACKQDNGSCGISITWRLGGWAPAQLPSSDQRYWWIKPPICFINMGLDRSGSGFTVEWVYSEYPKFRIASCKGIREIIRRLHCCHATNQAYSFDIFIDLLYSWCRSHLVTWKSRTHQSGKSKNHPQWMCFLHDVTWCHLPSGKLWFPRPKKCNHPGGNCYCEGDCPNTHHHLRKLHATEVCVWKANISFLIIWCQTQKSFERES